MITKIDDEEEIAAQLKKAADDLAVLMTDAKKRGIVMEFNIGEIIDDLGPRFVAVVKVVKQLI